MRHPLATYVVGATVFIFVAQPTFPILGLTSPLGILRDFRRATDALERLASTASAAIRNEHEHLELSERIDAVERERHRYEAEMEGLLLKAEGKLKAASNAEARERHQRAQYEKDLDPFPDDREEGQDPVQDIYAEGGEAEELQPLHLGLETNSKAHALRAKWS